MTVESKLNRLLNESNKLRTSATFSSNPEKKRSHLQELVDLSINALDLLDHTKTSFEREEYQIATYDNLGHAYYQLEDFEKSLESFRSALAIEPNNTYFLIKNGIVSFKLKQYGNSIAYFSTALTHEPQNEALFFTRGKVFYESGDSDSAIADFSKTIELNGEHLDAYLHRGMTYYSQGEYELARRDFTKLLKPHSLSRSNSMEAHFYTANISRFSKKFENDEIEKWFMIDRYQDVLKIFKSKQKLSKEDYIHALCAEHALFMLGEKESTPRHNVVVRSQIFKLDNAQILEFYKNMKF